MENEATQVYIELRQWVLRVHDRDFCATCFPKIAAPNLNENLSSIIVVFHEKRKVKRFSFAHQSEITGFLSDKDACDEIKSVLRKHFCEGISLAALLEDDSGNCGPLIGCNVLFKESTSEREYRTDKMKLFYQTWADLKKGVDVLKTFNCSDFINSCGLSVASDFRGQGIATELLRARAQVCRLTNIPVTANVFSGPYSHKAAAKAGFQTLSELDLSTYRIDNRIVFPEARGWPTAKYMANKYF
nr:PREDICTED: uncharacterized protein LOC109038652 isoform X2 [Bemisia tabaci]